MNNMDKYDKIRWVNEILWITQEECAEVIQAISKIFRFGAKDAWPKDGPNNQARLEEEVGDLLCMVDIMIEKGILSDSNVNAARHAKRDKLKTWSGIFM
jgi:NTP pyrophosphatase (non-canonical NTP hydrolase)